MHGRRKPTSEPTAEEKAARAKKLAKYRALFNASFDQCKARTVTPEALILNAKMLLHNPDFYSLWNHRREMLLKMWPSMEADALKASIDEELGVTKDCIAKTNPKSYCAWHHRQWIVGRQTVDLAAEMELCTKLLQYDERNFHCWNYRRWVAAKAKVPAADEFAFTTVKIEENFSNYSAWHYRTKLLPQLGPITVDTVSSELSLLESALFTEPADQSVWFYHRWLLGKLGGIAQSGGSEADEAKDVLRLQLENLSALAGALEEDGEPCKWPLLAEAYIMRLVGDEEEGVTDLYTQASGLDPRHRNFYAYAIATKSAMLGDNVKASSGTSSGSGGGGAGGGAAVSASD